MHLALKGVGLAGADFAVVPASRWDPSVDPSRSTLAAPALALVSVSRELSRSPRAPRKLWATACPPPPTSPACWFTAFK